jgi:hypothetical protein
MHTAAIITTNEQTNEPRQTAQTTQKTMLQTTILKKHKNEIMIAKDLINKNV